MKPVLIFGILIVCFLFAVGTLLILFEAASPESPLGTPTVRATQIDVTAVQFPTIPPSAPSYTVPIHALGSSGITGNVTFEDVSGAVAILLQVDGLQDEVIVPVELRHGTCAAPGALAYSLVSPDAGASETDLSIDLKQFNAQKPLAVMIYQSAQDRTLTACGDIP